jgi:hypothetical protein
LVVFVLFPDKRFRSAPERSTFEVLAADRPVHHVAQQLDDAVDGSGRQSPIRLTVDDARQLQVGDEVLDVGRLDVRQHAITEAIDQRLEPIVDRLADREPFREDVTLLVDVRELAERQRRDFARRLESALVERSIANCTPQITAW